jgi:hypothetical protein
VSGKRKDNMRFNVRFDSWEGRHVRCTLFANGANCGQLCFEAGEYTVFVAAFFIGAATVRPVLPIEVESTEEEKFRYKARQRADPTGEEKVATVEMSPMEMVELIADRLHWTRKK